MANRNWKMHTGTQTYQEADSKAAQYARDLFQKQLDDGARSAGRTIERVVNTVPQDAIVATTAMKFEPAIMESGGVVMQFDERDHDLHPHAFNQVAQRANVPRQYARDLCDAKEEWKWELLAHILNEVYKHNQARYLVRSIEGQVRGFLSDRYRRIDSRPVLDNFVGAVQDIGAVPLSGTATDTRFSLKAALPIVFEPVENEVMTYGLELRNSDFGHGALSVRFFMNRVWCTNLCSGEDQLRSVHLGKRLEDNIRYSDKTYQLDSEANASAVRDTVAAMLSPEAVEVHNNTIREAHDMKLTWAQAKKRLSSNLQKNELEKVEEAFTSKEVQMLPPGDNLWRLSNAISWLAVNTENDDRRLDLERVAGQMLDGSARSRSRR